MLHTTLPRPRRARRSSPRRSSARHSPPRHSQAGRWRASLAGGARRIAALLPAALLPAALLATACSTPNYDPPTLVQEMRVLAVKAEPPYIGVSPSTFSTFVVNPTPGEPLCYAWAVCLFAWENAGNFECLDPKLQLDLGNEATASTSLLALLDLLENLQPVLEAKGFNPPTTVDGVTDSGTDGGTDEPEGTEGLEIKLLFQVSEARVWGGACPNDTTAMLAKPCPSRDGCLMGHKALSVAIPTDDGGVPKAVHSNPTLLGVALNGVPWPASLTPTVAPYVAPTNPTLEQLSDLPGLELMPLWAPGSQELVAKSVDPGVPDRTERLVFSFFSNAGSFAFRRTGDAVPENGYLAKARDSGAESEPVRLWIVVRDDRGGVDWLQRRLRVDSAADPEVHPLCGPDPSIPKCPTETP